MAQKKLLLVCDVKSRLFDCLTAMVLIRPVVLPTVAYRYMHWSDPLYGSYRDNALGS